MDRKWIQGNVFESLGNETEEKDSKTSFLKDDFDSLTNELEGHLSDLSQMNRALAGVSKDTNTARLSMILLKNQMKEFEMMEAPNHESNHEKDFRDRT